VCFSFLYDKVTFYYYGVRKNVAHAHIGKLCVFRFLYDKVTFYYYGVRECHACAWSSCLFHDR
jgi:hypothetical protein